MKDREEWWQSLKAVKPRQAADSMRRLMRSAPALTRVKFPRSLSPSDSVSALQALVSSNLKQICPMLLSRIVDGDGVDIRGIWVLIRGCPRVIVQLSNLQHKESTSVRCRFNFAIERASPRFPESLYIRH